MTTTILNQTIDDAFDREVASMLRRRFLWLCGVLISFGLLRYVIAIVRPLVYALFGWDYSFDFSNFQEGWNFLIDEGGRLVVLGAALWITYTKCRTQAHILRVAFWTIIVLGISFIVGRLDLTDPMPVIFRSGESEAGAGVVDPIAPLGFTLAVMHLFMCLFLPWSPSQAIRPLLVLIPVWAMATFAYDGFGPGFINYGFLIWPIITGVALFFCWIRQSQLWETVENRVLHRHFTEAHQELLDARRIHESRFPQPLTAGPVRLNFAYEPMRLIGGDFIHTRVQEDGTLHTALIDVTGHGITAALAVNRMDGELTRLTAENPDIGPDELLSKINQYIHLTMAKHSIYATAFCFSLTPDGTLEWVNGGHPPGFIRRENGDIDELDSTTFMLGACPSEAFDPDCQTTTISRGDQVIVYTDGACEAVDKRGRQFGIRGLLQAIEQWEPNGQVDLIPFLPEIVSAYRAGPPLDDVLFAVATVDNASTVVV